MASKLTFGQQAQSAATRLAETVNLCRDLQKTWFDRGYNSGGSSPIIDGDVASLGITAANMASFITLAQQLINFAGNAAVTTADYQGTMDLLRTDI